MFLKVNFILLIVAFIIQLLALAIPYWYSTEILGTDYHGSLFRTCAKNSNANYNACGNIKSKNLASKYIFIIVSFSTDYLRL